MSELFVATAKEMQSLDNFVIEKVGILPEILMERAGHGVAETIRELFPISEGAKALILCGPGNNGGDGFVCARYLWNWGYEVEVLLFSSEERYRGEAKRNLDILRGLGVPISPLKDLSELEEFFKYLKPTIVVDALFGTGLTRPLSGLFEETVSFLNEVRSKSPFLRIISIDIPSGVSADTGQILGVAVKADYTVTFECLKAGHLFYPGKGFAGEVKVVSLGYPWRFIKEATDLVPQRTLLNERVASALFKPRKGYYHKGKAGHVLVLAGSQGKSGAAYLTALGALRGGAGLVTLASPRSLQPFYCTLLPEALTLGLPEREGEVSEEALELLWKALEGKRVLVIGPGFGLGAGPQRVLWAILEKAQIPLVLDADALTLLSKEPERLKRYRGTKIICPHPGEAARLLGITTQEVLKDLLGSLQKLVDLTGAVVALKGPHTLIGDPSGKIYISSIDEPSLAQGGMGDVLTGLIGALLSQGYEALTATALAVYLHGASGQSLHKDKGPLGLLASEIANHIPQILKRWESNS